MIPVDVKPILPIPVFGVLGNTVCDPDFLKINTPSTNNFESYVEFQYYDEIIDGVRSIQEHTVQEIFWSTMQYRASACQRLRIPM